MPVMSGAQALVRSLARHGVEVVFGLPGVQIMDIFDALYDEPGIRMILTRHEQATTYMADGYARTTGKPGVALVVPGPGALNATAGLGTAYATSSPVPAGVGADRELQPRPEQGRAPRDRRAVGRLQTPDQVVWAIRHGE